MSDFKRRFDHCRYIDPLFDPVNMIRIRASPALVALELRQGSVCGMQAGRGEPHPGCMAALQTGMDHRLGAAARELRMLLLPPRTPSCTT